MNLLERLAAMQLLVVTGKGGVGKSTLTAALGRLLVGHGRRVLLLEIDPRESLYQMLDVDPSGGQFEQVSRGLYLQNLSPREVMDQLIRERIPLGILADRVLSSPIYRHFAETAPGLKEVTALQHALRVVEGQAGGQAPQVDLVVLDAPATGHGVSMLAAPKLVSEVIQDGPVGQMGSELAAFVADTDRCGVVVATVAEEMPVQETLELIESLDKRLNRRPELVLVNSLYPERDSGEPPRRGDPVLDLWQERRRVNERELGRLNASWSGPRVDLPLLALERGSELAETLGFVLRDGLEAGLSWS